MKNRLRIKGVYAEVHSVLKWNHVLRIDDTRLELWIQKHGKRALVELPNQQRIHSAITSDGDQGYCIKLNSGLRKALGINAEGEEIYITIEPDESEYGMSVSSVFQSVLDEDAVFAKYFNALTPGKRRSLIYWVDQPKANDIKERRAFILSTHLIEEEGALDFKKLNALVKQVNASFKKNL